MNSPTLMVAPAQPEACRTRANDGVSHEPISHPICDACETVSWCSKSGCIPVTPTSFIKQCKAIDAAKRHNRANELFLARLNELLAAHREAA